MGIRFHYPPRNVLSWRLMLEWTCSVAVAFAHISLCCSLSPISYICATALLVRILERFETMVKVMRFASRRI
ncbi:hypothetical protein CDL15_Pgr022319 [Punica granatum]|uniref:Uncharacterized protein n=1 Tax=Punica granatum TaxID=22663 RepID=A0A218WVM4_PUNGR|nr:hypothetical protein CDL15_Pgr022319 [Punica granatum]